MNCWDIIPSEIPQPRRQTQYDFTYVIPLKICRVIEPECNGSCRGWGQGRGPTDQRVRNLVRWDECAPQVSWECSIKGSNTLPVILQISQRVDSTLNVLLTIRKSLQYS